MYPIIKSFGDDILFMDKIRELKSKLAHLITSEQVDRLHITFSTLVFYELEIEKANSKTEYGEPVQDYDPAAMMHAVNIFKDVSATATFGKFGLRGTIGKKY